MLVQMRPERIMAAVVLLGSLAACQTASPTPEPQSLQITTQALGPVKPVVRASGPAQGEQPVQPVRAEQALKIQCEENLHNIAGLLLEFYSVSGQMPPSLASLQQIADADEPLNLTSPQSGQPFGYSSLGLSRPDMAMKVYVWDAQAGPDGCRECLVSNEAPQLALQLNVQEVGEADFQIYHPGGELLAGAAATGAIGQAVILTPAPQPSDIEQLNPDQMQQLHAAMHPLAPVGAAPPTPPQQPASIDTQQLTPEQMRMLRSMMHQQIPQDPAADAQQIPDVSQQPSPDAPQQPSPDPQPAQNPSGMPPASPDNSQPQPDILSAPGQ